MSDVEILREAAALMRQRAKAASPSGEGYAGGWNGYVMDDGRAELFCGPAVDGYRTGLVFSFPDYEDCEEGGRPSNEDVAHIASWHPVVALAVADLLDTVAEHIGSYACEAYCELDGCDESKAATALARTYLGRDS